MERKAAKKISTLYRTVFHMEAPFKIIADGNFLHKCIQNKVFLKDKFEKYLGETVLIYVTDCIISELKSLGSKTEGTYLAARKFKNDRCSHGTQLSPDLCILEHVGNLAQLHYTKPIIGAKNKGNFFVATQDYSLKRRLRDIGRVGIFTFNESKQLELEKPSGKMYDIMREREKSQQMLTPEEKRQLKEVRKLRRVPYVPETQKVAYQNEQDVYKQTLCMG